MNRYTGIVATLLIGLSLSLGSISDAEAKRFGGGSSFGGRSSFSQPYKRSADAPARSATQQQQQAAQPNQAAKPSWSRGLMGMLGGLALGGLLGSLLAGGAFQGINFLDILVLAALAFMLYKFFAAKKAREQQPVYDRTAGHYDNSASAYTPYQEPQSSSSNPSGFDTDIMFKKDKPSAEPAMQSFQQDADFGQSQDIAVPAGFDTQAFLSGAKTAFKTLQKAWDDRDLAEIRGLTTDKVFAEIQDQLKASSEENRTDILKLDAELLEVREVGSELQAVVLFDVIMREDADAQTNQVREVWHFIKPKNSIQPTWYLDGIQQLED
ncbi:Tim44 domain-containing protein [Methylobacter sp. YRD-M1]|uniref:Tim44 domain-containing protein n=1 Tax=Methylobacter sp. YRD-M1 TaxID=2911520 RepID=UPI00227D02F7|nr:TIM44-like domain-containing protein [Methylobacter sp. YRD-M1]WAK02269.1 Tim44-like domain-containing protein [Methylobacter sp. YRD-M1]